MSTYKNSRRDTAIADEYLSGHFPCSHCGQMAPREDLSNFGARCYGCFQSYCAEKNADVGCTRTLQDKLEILEALRSIAKASAQGSKDWAKRLQAREEAGEELSVVQRRSWREALRGSPAEVQP